MSTSRSMQINIDGAARGNPGPAAFAYVIAVDGEPVLEEAGRLGEATNNVAEYTALIRALERAVQLKATHLLIRSDSELLVKQLNGEYKVKNATLRDLYDRAVDLTGQFRSVQIEHVRRDRNKRADQLCNAALDGRLEAVGSPPAKSEPPPAKAPRPSAIQAKLLEILHEAATAWGGGVAVHPSPETVCRRVVKMLAHEGILSEPET